jgi:allantoin racemase
MTRQRIAVLGSGDDAQGSEHVPAQIAAVAGATFEPQLQQLRLSAFPGTPYDRSLAVIASIDAGIAAARSGASAVFINTFGDYGIAELRSALSIPVVGAGEAAMAVAATLGRRFSIVTIWPRSLGFIYDERLASCGMGRRCTGVRYVLDEGELANSAYDDPVAKLRAADATLLDRVMAAADAAVRQDGADTIVLGCTCMSPIAARIASRINVPVVDAMVTGYVYAEALVTLRIRQSALAYPQPAQGRLEAIAALIDGREQPAADERCSVCVIATSD